MTATIDLRFSGRISECKFNLLNTETLKLTSSNSKEGIYNVPIGTLVSPPIFKKKNNNTPSLPPKNKNKKQVVISKKSKQRTYDITTAPTNHLPENNTIFTTKTRNGPTPKPT